MAALTEDGTLYMWGRNTLTDRMELLIIIFLQSLTLNIVICCGLLVFIY